MRGDGTEEALTASEHDLLKLFVSHPNRALMRDWLLESGSYREADAFDRAIDNRILRPRRELEADPAKPEAIRSTRDVGYIFVPPKESSGYAMLRWRSAASSAMRLVRADRS